MIFTPAPMIESVADDDVAGDLGGVDSSGGAAIGGGLSW